MKTLLKAIFFLMLPTTSMAISGGTEVLQGDASLTIGSMTLTTAGQGIKFADGTIQVTSATASGGGNALLASTQTWTGQNNWVTPAPSTFTYGVVVGSLTVNGPGNGVIALTISGGTYDVISSSVTPTVGNLAIFTSTNGTVGNGGTGGGGGGTPSAPLGGVQIDSAGVFAASSNFTVVGSSVQINNGTLSNAPYIGGTGVLDIFTNLTTGNILTLGSTNAGVEVAIPQGQRALFSNGTRNGCLQEGTVTGNESIIDACNAATQFINIWSGSKMIFQTASAGDGATVPDFIFKPAVVEEVRISTVTGITLDAPAVSFTLAISSNGHVISTGTTPSVSSCGTGSPSVIGNDHAGTITIGGGSVTACTLTFSVTYGAGCTVVCVTSDSITTATPDVVSTPTTMTLGFSATIGGGTVNYQCEGVGPTCH